MDQAGDKWKNMGQKDFSYLMDDSENDYEITFPELSSWVEHIRPKNPACVKYVCIHYCKMYVCACAMQTFTYSMKLTYLFCENNITYCQQFIVTDFF